MSNQETRTERDLFSGRDGSLGERLLLAWDLSMIVLVSINLALIVVDALYGFGAVSPLLSSVSPAADNWYDRSVHQNFFAIDLAFVAIFVADVLGGWAVAIYQRRYPRWFFYPFAHWYDVLGCIPVAGFRLLRVLRLISMLLRLQRLGVIDMSGWTVYQNLMVYYDILVEEISDRVVIKILSGTQEELSSGGGKLARRAIDEIVEPRRERMTQAAAKRLESAITDAYSANRDQLQRYVADVVHRGVARNAAVKNLERLPMLGRTLNHALDDAIRDSVNNLLDETVESCTAAEFERLLQSLAAQVIDHMLAEHSGAPSEVNAALTEVLELVKDQVAIKRWHEHFETPAKSGADTSAERAPQAAG